MSQALLASPRHGPAEAHENEFSDVDEEQAPRGASVGAPIKHASKGAGAAPMAHDFIRGANSACVDVGR